MHPREYEILAQVEDQHWWFCSAHAVALETLVDLRPAAKRILDAGCGTGGFLRRLSQLRPEFTLFGLEPWAWAVRQSRVKSQAQVCQADIQRQPFADQSFDAAISLDVLCHEAVDPLAALIELRRVLRPGGLLILSLPAYKWMMSAHDRHVGNVRRFSPHNLRDLAQAADFRVDGLFFWNSWLFPLMALRRLVGREAQSSDVKPWPPLLDSLFRGILTAERKCARLGLRLPFGGSLLVALEKP